MLKRKRFNLAGSPGTRWFIIILTSAIMAANYYFYDALSSIKMVLQTELGFSNTDYGLIVSFYAVLNIVMVVVGGALLDKWGIRPTGFLFLFLCTLGAFITAYGVSDYYNAGGFGYSFMKSFLPGYSPALKMMMFGRLLFGLGSESLTVVINKIIAKWFKGKEIAFAFAVNLAIARFGTAMALIYSPIAIGGAILINGVYHFPDYTFAVWLATMLVIISMLLFIVYNFFDVRLDKQRHRKQDEETSEIFKWSDAIKLFKNRSFVYICILCVLFYSAVFPFLGYAPDLLFNKYGLNMESSSAIHSFLAMLQRFFGNMDPYRISLITSGLVASFVPLGTILFTPLAGLFVDKKGRSASLMIYGSIMLVLVHLSLAFTNISPFVPIFFLGVSFSLVPAALWPSVARIVKEDKLGAAYGVMTSIQNLGLFVFPVLIGWVLDTTNKEALKQIAAGNKATFDYTYALIVFAAIGVVGTVFAVLLKREDHTKKDKLEKPFFKKKE